MSVSTVVTLTLRANGGDVALLHDAGGNRWTTVRALPYIIEGFQEKGLTFETLCCWSGRAPTTRRIGQTRRWPHTEELAGVLLGLLLLLMAVGAKTLAVFVLRHLLAPLLDQ